MVKFYVQPPTLTIVGEVSHDAAWSLYQEHGKECTSVEIVPDSSENNKRSFPTAPTLKKQRLNSSPTRLNSSLTSWTQRWEKLLHLEIPQHTSFLLSYLSGSCLDTKSLVATTVATTTPKDIYLSAISKDGKYVACVTKGQKPHADRLKVWNSGEMIFERRARQRYICDISFNPVDNSLAVAGHPGFFILTLEPLTQTFFLPGQEAVLTSQKFNRKYKPAVTSCAWSADGSRLFTIGPAQGTATVWRKKADNNFQKDYGLVTGKPGKLGPNDHTWRLIFSKITCLSPNGSVALFKKRWGHIRDDIDILYEDSKRGVVVKQNVSNHGGFSYENPIQEALIPECAAFSPSGSYVACGSGKDHNITIWNLREREEKERSSHDPLFAITQHLILRGHTEPVTCLLFSQDGSLLVSGSKDNTLKAWDASNGQLLQTFTGHESNIKNIWLSEDKRFLTSLAGDRCLKTWCTGQHL